MYRVVSRNLGSVKGASLVLGERGISSGLKIEKSSSCSFWKLHDWTPCKCSDSVAQRESTGGLIRLNQARRGGPRTENVQDPKTDPRN